MKYGDTRRGPLVEQRLAGVLEYLEPAEADTDERAHALFLFVGGLEARSS